MKSKKYLYIVSFCFILFIVTVCLFNTAKSTDGSVESVNGTIRSKDEIVDIMDRSLKSVQNTNIKTNVNLVQFNVLGKTNLVIEKQRIKDEFYGVNHLNNRWNLDEVDNILSAIKGYWKPDEYKGFVDDSLYYPDLFVDQKSLGADVIEKLLDDYNQKILNAQNNIPDVTFSVKEKNGGDVESNYIYTNGIYPSPVGIILSLDRISDFYPVFSDRTTISKDIIVEYPVLYIQFFLRFEDKQVENEYLPATLIISSDNQYLILIGGAYYSLKAINS